MHFFAVAIFGVGRLLMPRPTFRCHPGEAKGVLWRNGVSNRRRESLGRPPSDTCRPAESLGVYFI
jgi:hypothetical protein